MRPEKRVKLFAVMGAACLLGILWLVSIGRYSQGVVIRLDTDLRDPWTPLLGDTMILNLRINTIEVSGALEVPEPGELIWVNLVKDGPFRRVAGYEPLSGKRNHDGLYVRGIVVESGSRGKLRVEYGLETYFVPEGRGTPEHGVITVDVDVLQSGALRLRTVYLDGEPYP